MLDIYVYNMDNADRARIEETLRSFCGGFEIKNAKDGASVLRNAVKAGRDRDRLVMADTDDEAGEGLSFLAEIRRENCSFRTVAVSARRSFDLAKQVIDLQLDGLLSLPPEPGELSLLLERLFPLSFGLDGVDQCADREKNNEQIKRNLIRKAINVIESNLDRDLSLEFVAEKINISSCYLSSVFHRISGRNFSNYVTDLRMDRAVDLLLHSDYNVSEVAARVGYNNPPYFSTIFKKKTGLSPSQLRGSGQVSIMDRRIYENRRMDQRQEKVSP